MKPSILATIAFTPLVLLAGCGPQGGSVEAPAEAPSAVEAAAAGVSEVIRSEAAGRPIPREGLPDYVETAPGGSYVTSSSGANALRTTGMLLYFAPGSVADLVAFHRASMERHGMTPTEATSRPVRHTTETSFEGRSADGRFRLSVSIIDDESKPVRAVQMNFSEEKG